MKIVIATHNQKKGGEMAQIMGEALPDIEFVPLTDFQDAPEPEETGTTYKENALIKARSSARFTGEWSLADDAGLEIDAIPGELGLFSKRFAGVETTFEEKIRLVLDKMEGLPRSERKARFVCHVALVSPIGEEQSFYATLEGEISIEPKGSGGFGYDPIFYVESLNKCLAELTPEQKHAISHRGKVLAQVIEHLRQKQSNG